MVKYTFTMKDETVISAVVDDPTYSLSHEILTLTHDKFVKISSDNILFYPKTGELRGLEEGNDRLYLNTDHLAWFTFKKEKPSPAPKTYFKGKDEASRIKELEEYRERTKEEREAYFAQCRKEQKEWNDKVDEFIKHEKEKRKMGVDIFVEEKE